MGWSAGARDGGKGAGLAAGPSGWLVARWRGGSGAGRWAGASHGWLAERWRAGAGGTAGEEDGLAWEVPMTARERAGAFCYGEERERELTAAPTVDKRRRAHAQSMYRIRIMNRSRTQ